MRLVGPWGPSVAAPITSCRPLSLPRTDLLALRDILSLSEMLDPFLHWTTEV